MLTNEDIKKLKEALSTKEDLSELREETKRDLGQLGTKMDQNFAKVDKNFAKVDQDFTKVLTLDEFDQFKVEIKQDIDGLREMVQSLVVSVDKLVKAVTDLKTEYVVITNKVDRHEKWFHLIAEKVGVKLEY